VFDLMERVIFFVLLNLFSIVSCAYIPTVLMHGIVGEAEQLSHTRDLLSKYFPGMYTVSIEIGNFPKFDSVFMSLDEQIDSFCKQLASDKNLTNGINLIGYSQGGVIARSYLERCNNPPVINFISWVSPQGGQFGVPNLGNLSSDALDDIFDCCAYDEGVQDLFSFASYWRDPWQLDNYVEYCQVLPDINNERSKKNASYKKNILNLKNFVYSYSEVDVTLKPKETGWFGVFAPNSEDVVIPLEQTDLWNKDWIGLKTLYNQGKLHKFSTNCGHGDYYSSCFDSHFIENVIPFLK